MRLAPSKSNATALTVFDGILEVQAPTPTTEPEIIGVTVSKVIPGEPLKFTIVFNQIVRDFTIDDIEVTAPAQLISWLLNGRLQAANQSKWDRVELVYDVSSDFDASTLGNYNLRIQIRAGGIQGQGS